MIRKEELLRLAEFGARRDIADLEIKLNQYQRTFPNLFITDERIVLLKAELRVSTSGNGHISDPEVKSAKMRAAWTPERRARAAEAMRELRKKKGPGRYNHAEYMRERRAKKRAETEAAAAPKKAKSKSTKKSKTKPAKKSETRLWKDIWFDHLQAHGAPQSLRDSAKQLKTSSGTLLSSSTSYLKEGIIEKTEPGFYKAVARPN